MNKSDVLAIVMVLGPRLELNLKLTAYLNKGPCVDWLVNLTGGTTWDAEMEALDNEKSARRKAE